MAPLVLPLWSLEAEPVGDPITDRADLARDGAKRPAISGDSCSWLEVREASSSECDRTGGGASIGICAFGLAKEAVGELLLAGVE